MDLPAGTVVAGKYRVTHELGRGGMGVVVAARHERLGHEVAIKVLLDTRRPAALVRFQREARVVVQLRSEHICRVIDVGELDDEHPFMVMEKLEGRDLKQLLRVRGALPLDEAVDLVMQALDGLAEAHERGVVHRDLKPANLFVTERSDGSPWVKVLDFGISKDLGSTHGVTATGDLVGSPRYMAPEQLAAVGAVGPRTDVFAMGVVLYELVTGRPAFTATSPAELALYILQYEPTALSLLRPELPSAFTAMVERCLAKNPRQRFDAPELARALALFGPKSAQLLAQRISTRPSDSRSSDPLEAPAAMPTRSSEMTASARADGPSASTRAEDLTAETITPATPGSLTPASEKRHSARRWSLMALGGTALAAGIVAGLVTRRTELEVTPEQGPPDTTVTPKNLEPVAPTTVGRPLPVAPSIFDHVDAYLRDAVARNGGHDALTMVEVRAPATVTVFLQHADDPNRVRHLHYERGQLAREADDTPLDRVADTIFTDDALQHLGDVAEDAKKRGAIDCRPESPLWYLQVQRKQPSFGVPHGPPIIRVKVWDEARDCDYDYDQRGRFLLRL